MSQCANQYLKDNIINWIEMTRWLTDAKHYDLAQHIGQLALNKFGINVDILFQIGVGLQFQNKLEAALEIYFRILEIDPNHTLTLQNIGALYQVVGNIDEATKYYQKVGDHMFSEAGFLNNFGMVLIQSSKKDDVLKGVNLLRQAIQMNPNLESALVNLASYYVDDCQLEEAKVLYNRAAVISQTGKQIQIRLALMISSVVTSWSQMVNERRSMMKKLQSLVDEGPAPPNLFHDLDSIMDHIHFYIVYAGLNDRHIQESVSKIYNNFIRDMSLISSYLNLNSRSPLFKLSHSQSNSHLLPHPNPPLHPSLTLLTPSTPIRIKVGFLSKYFGVFEPHGLLLEGVMKYLPRSLFEVFTITTRPNVGKYLSPSVVNSSDSIHFIPQIHSLAFQQISELQLDILIFADTLSEPLVHFLAQTRIAPYQVAFWGNPLTSGSPHMDYFISSDFMEHPYRTRLRDHEEPYTEQVVLLPGQGIWYSSPDSEEYQGVVSYLNLTIHPRNETFLRQEFGLQDDWFIFLCPQSVFKVHPLFDQVLAAILRESPKSHLVLTTGRKESWTTIYLQRMEKSLASYRSRYHLAERVTSQKFLALIKLADVLLHPFPFDGSRTSADGLSVGIPFVTLPSEYLRGRMGASLLRTMNIPELVAHNSSEYIQISVRLSTDVTFYKYIKSLITTRSWLIWNDMSCPFSWTSFLALAVGSHPPTWEEYITSLNLNLEKESKIRFHRENNQRTFDLRWGTESWLLDEHGIPNLPDLISENETLPIFNNWKRGSLTNEIDDIQQQHHHQNEREVWDENEETRMKLLYSAHNQALTGNIQEAINIEMSLLEKYFDDPQINLEIGILHYFQGNHRTALHYCEEASRFLSQRGGESRQILGCIGVCATYLSDENKSVAFLSKAWDLRHQQLQISPLFSFSQRSIEKSLTTCLRTFKRYDECVNFFSSIFELPLRSRGGSLIVFLSVYEFSENTTKQIQQLVKELLLLGKIEGTLDVVSEVKRIQSNFDDLIETARDCLVSSLRFSSTDLEMVSLSLQDTMRLVSSSHSNIARTLNNNLAQAQGGAQGRDDKIVLLSQYYLPNSQSTDDIDSALLKNLANPFISDVYLLNEKLFDLGRFPQQEKLHQVVIGKRVTFQDIFQYANEHLINKLVIIANSDIYFDERMGILFENMKHINQSAVFALSKWINWDIQNDFITLFPRVDSQDAWIVRSPVPRDVVELSPFYLGTPRCDNRLASIFLNAGYTVSNPAFHIHAIELLSTPRATGLYDMNGATLGETRNVFLTDQFP